MLPTKQARMGRRGLRGCHVVRVDRIRYPRPCRYTLPYFPLRCCSYLTKVHSYIWLVGMPAVHTVGRTKTLGLVVYYPAIFPAAPPPPGPVQGNTPVAPHSLFFHRSLENIDGNQHTLAQKKRRHPCTFVTCSYLRSGARRRSFCFPTATCESNAIGRGRVSYRGDALSLFEVILT